MNRNCMYPALSFPFYDYTSFEISPPWRDGFCGENPDHSKSVPDDSFLPGIFFRGGQNLLLCKFFCHAIFVLFSAQIFFWGGAKVSEGTKCSRGKARISLSRLYTPKQRFHTVSYVHAT